MTMISKYLLGVMCVLSFALIGAECTTVTDINPADNGGSGGGGTPNQITVRMVNASPSVAVAVQLYSSTGTVTNPDAELFVASNQQLAGIGFAGSGILQPNQTDEVQLACTAAATIGTSGGAFLNVDTGAQVGAGTRYVLALGSQYQCGSTITFTYTPSGNGYRTDVSVVGPGG